MPARRSRIRRHRRAASARIGAREPGLRRQYCRRRTVAVAFFSPSPAASSAAAAAEISSEDNQEASQLDLDPLAPKRAFTIEDENTQSVAGANNQINLVGQVPLGINPPIAELLAGGHALSFIRVKLPIVTTSPTSPGVDAITGTGDLSVSRLAGFGGAESRWAAGASFNSLLGRATSDRENGRLDRLSATRTKLDAGR